MTINCTLDDFRFPGLPTYPNQFGTKKVSGQGLSTAECCDDMAMPFTRQRPYIITETSETTELHANSVFKITAADITLTIEDAVYDGCTALIVNNSTGTVTVKGGVSGLDGSTAGVKLHKGQFLSLVFCSGWITSGGSAASFLLSHPVGSYWWTQDDTDPNEAYGGTWVRVKDKFVFAAGDSYSAGNTGGNASVTLSTSQLPSHTHSFTPEGSVAGHTHGLAGHTHTFTPAGSVSSHAHGLAGHTHSFRGTTENRYLGNSANLPLDVGDRAGNNYAVAKSYNNAIYIKSVYSDFPGSGAYAPSNSVDSSVLSINSTHNHDYSGTTGGNSGNTAAVAPVFTGKAGTTSGNSGATASTAPAFTGKAGSTGETGAGSAVNIMPPYEVANCWRRTA